MRAGGYIRKKKARFGRVFNAIATGSSMLRPFGG
jgi:hypothetical protein